MSKQWQWTGRYIVVIIIAVVLATVLGSMGLFETTTLGKKLTAANIVQFLGYGAALGVFWLLGQRASLTFRSDGGRWEFLQHLILPLVTLIVVASAHGVFLIMLRRMLDAGQRNLYNWLFIVGIIASAAWFVAALFKHSSPLTEAVTSAAQRVNEATDKTACGQCGSATKPGQKFCDECGHALTG